MGDGQPESTRRRVTKKVQRTLFDLETGETRDFEWEEPVASRRPKDARAQEPFAIAFPAGMRALAKLGLTGTDLAVLFFLVGIMGFEDSFKASSTLIGAALELDRRNIARSLSRLKAKGVLLDRGRAMVLINPDYFWRGRIPKRLLMLHQLETEKTTKNRSGSAAKEG